MALEVYDLIIIGGGPIGITCAIEAEKNNLKYLVIEKGVLVNSLYHFPTNMTFFSTSKLLEIGEVPFISHSEKPTRRESLEYFRRVYQNYKLKINFYEEVKSMQPASDNQYLIHTSQQSYHSRAVIVATGFFDTPRLMNIPGENLPKVQHYYDEVHPYVGQKLLVVGAANSACDIALEAYHKGAEVSMVVRKDEISPRVKYWIRPNIINRIKEGSIKAYFNASLKIIKPSYVIINTPKGEVKLDNDFVLAMTGYQPNYDLLDNLGIAYTQDEHRRPLLNPDTLESNLPNVYLAGVVVSGMQTSKLFIENSREHAKLIIKDIFQKNMDGPSANSGHQPTHS